LLKDSVPEVRTSAILAMGLMPGHFAPSLAEVFANASEVESRRILAVTALSDAPGEVLASDRVLPLLIKALDLNAPVEVQVAAAKLLAMMKAPAAAVALRSFLQSKEVDERVRRALSAR
jgi:HEAT repeat protein